MDYFDWFTKKANKVNPLDSDPYFLALQGKYDGDKKVIICCAKRPVVAKTDKYDEYKFDVDVRLSRVTKTISLRCRCKNGRNIWMAGFGGVFDVKNSGYVTVVSPVEKVQNMIKGKKEPEIVKHENNEKDDLLIALQKKFQRQY
ncbi:MAG: hypothetical protein ACLRFI_03215 [Alphaproteobacteria bacterium]